MMADNNNTAIAVVESDAPISPFTSIKAFETAQRMATILCSSSLVPTAYQGRENLPNCVIALEMANRIGVSPFLIMQNMNVIKGKPSMSAQYLIAMVNASGKFSPLRWKIQKRGIKKFDYFAEDGWDSAAKKKRFRRETAEFEDCTYIAYATELATGAILEGPEVTSSMVAAEGWYGKDGSKWKTMPDLMFRYRSAAFFSKTHCPEMAMGLKSTEEIEDMPPEAEVKKVNAVTRAEDLTKKLIGGEPAPSEEDFTSVVDVAPKAAQEEKRSRPARPTAADEPARATQAAAPEVVEPEPPAREESLTHGQQAIDFGGSPSDDVFEIPGVSVGGDEEPF